MKDELGTSKEGLRLVPTLGTGASGSLEDPKKKRRSQETNKVSSKRKDILETVWRLAGACEESSDSDPEESESSRGCPKPATSAPLDSSSDSDSSESSSEEPARNKYKVIREE